MADLTNGVRRYQERIHPAHQELFDRLATGQSPEAMFITCSDSRIDPTLITQSLPGELFIARNAGNIVPAVTTQDLNPDGIVGAVEFAVKALRVGEIVVCGHSDCGAMKGALTPGDLADLPYVRAWVEHSAAAVDSGSKSLSEVVRRNVLLQLDHLRTYDFVADAERSGALRLTGWVYDIGSGDVDVLTG